MEPLRSTQSAGEPREPRRISTGYSSLGYLDRYEIDTLKIDRSFVARMLGQRRAMAILESIMRLGTALEVDIVAEGVETQAQFEKLRDMRCGHIQGFLLSRLLSVENMTALLGCGPETSVRETSAT